VIAEELGLRCRITKCAGPERPRDIGRLLTTCSPTSLLFIDEIPPLTVAGTALSQAMETTA